MSAKKALIIFLLQLWAGQISFGQYTLNERNALRDSIINELNHSRNKPWLKKDFENILDQLNRPDLFPYSSFDSVKCVAYTMPFEYNASLWNNNYSQFKSNELTLDSADIVNILRIINNPLNYDWGECGTPFIESEILFYYDNSVIASVQLACSGGQLFCTPANALVRWGNLKLTSSDKLYSILY